uniref:Uncharacterized protein n=1 Tax=Tanacetum cinerariifolium TaxID=118510 RepID=A0A6L2JRG7_TANCI|nr:hypothetical protein [Tanacetum cinerariifolium]
MWRSINNIWMINMASQRKEEQQSLKATKGTKTKAAKATKPAGDKASTLTSTQPPKPKPAPTQPSKVVPEKKRKLVKETPDEPSPAKRSKGGLVGKIRKPSSPTQNELRTSSTGDNWEPDSGRIQPLPDVQEKGKKKVINEQAAHDLLTLLTPKNKSPIDQFIFQRRTPRLTQASGHVESPSLDAELALTDSETEFDNVASKIDIGDQDEGQAGPNPGDHDEGQAGPNPGVQDEGQAGSNPSDAAESQPQSKFIKLLTQMFRRTSPSEDPVILEEPASSTRTLSSLQNLEKELSFTHQFFVEKQQKEGKTNAEAEVQSMVSVPIHQDTSSVPPMTTPDLTTSQYGSPLPTSTATTSAVITTTIPPPPPQPQQSTADPTLVKRIDELEQHMANLLQYNLALKERLDNMGPGHHKKYDAPEKSLERDYSDQLLSDPEKACQKKRKRRDLPRTLSGSPPPQPPSPPPAGASGAPGTSRASSQLPLPPPSSTGTSESTQQQCSEAPSSSKSAASAPKSMAWTTSDTQYESTGVSGTRVISYGQALSSSKSAASTPQSMGWTTSDTRYESASISKTQELSHTESLIQDDSIPNEHVHLSDDEDSGNDHLPKVDSRKDYVENKWATALVSAYETPFENSLLAKTRDAGPNPGVQDEGQAGSNPGDAAESQPQSSHVVHAGPNLEHMDLEATNALTQQNLEQMDEEFTTTAYPNVQENLKLPYEDQVILEEPASSTGTLTSLQNLEEELSFTYQFFMKKQ